MTTLRNVMRGCGQAVTVWNRYTDKESGKDIFVRHVIPVLCNWRHSVKRNESSTGSSGRIGGTGTLGRSGSAGIANSLTVIVPFCEEFRYYDDWVNLDEEGKETFFTLNVSDLIALGVHDVEITGERPFTESCVRGSLSGRGATVSTFMDATGGADARFGAHFRVGCSRGFKEWS